MPALAPVIDTLDKVPEAVRGFYEPKDGKHYLILDATPHGFAPVAERDAANTKLAEFRDKNIALMQADEASKTKWAPYAGIEDPVAAKAALEAVAALGKKGVTKPSDIETAVAAAVKAANEPLMAKLAASEAIAEANAKRADAGTLRAKIDTAFKKAGGRPDAIDDVVARATSVFTVKEGEVVALPTKFSADKPSEALGMDEWLAGLAKANVYLFQPSVGAGADPVKGGGAGARPGQVVLTDPTPQQLGEYSKDILLGKVKVNYTK
jgi:hypothetical protein